MSSPLLLLHGFTDTGRTWDLARPSLEAAHDVLAPTLPGHFGGPPLAEASMPAVIDHLEAVMDDAGWDTAHIAGNSLGGFLSLHLGARGRARSVVAFAPAGGWAEEDDSYNATLDHFVEMQEQVRNAAPHADAIAETENGRRRATAFITTNYEHIPADLIAHQIRGVAGCEAAGPLIELARREGWAPVDAAAIECPVRIVWGTDDQILPWPRAAAWYREQLPHADWVELDGIGHCPQLDVPAETAQLILGFSA